MIRKLFRFTLSWLTIWTVAVGFTHFAKGQTYYYSAPTCSMSCSTSSLAWGDTASFTICNYYDTYTEIDGESQGGGFDPMGTVDWSVSGAGSIGGSGSNVTLTAGTAAAGSVLTVSATVHESFAGKYTVVRFAVGVLGPHIMLEINATGTQDNYLSLGGTGALTVGVPDGDSDKNYAVSLSCTGSGSPSGNVTFSNSSFTVPGGCTETQSLAGTAPGFFTITGTPYYSTVGGTASSEAATGTVGGAVVQVDIKRSIGGGTPTPITGGTTSVMVGQYINLTGVTQPVLSGSWSVPGTLVKGYTQSLALGTTAALSNADLSGGTIGYYWIAGGTGQVVSYSTTVGSVSFSASTTFNVLSPSATLTCVTTTNTPPVNCADNAGLADDPCLHIGSATPLSPGISWTGTVKTPPGGAGMIASLQLVKAALSVSPAGRPAIAMSSGGDYVLDNTPEASPGIQYGIKNPTTPIGDSDTQPNAHNDSPDIPLEGATKASDDEGFHLYLMYKPSGDSIWVTLREVDWNWKGSCTLNGTWSMDAPGSASANPASADSTALPTWNDYYTNLKWHRQQ